MHNPGCEPWESRNNRPQIWRKPAWPDRTGFALCKIYDKSQPHYQPEDTASQFDTIRLCSSFSAYVELTLIYSFKFK